MRPRQKPRDGERREVRSVSSTSDHEVKLLLTALTELLSDTYWYENTRSVFDELLEDLTGLNCSDKEEIAKLIDQYATGTQDDRSIIRAELGRIMGRSDAVTNFVKMYVELKHNDI